jgi:hypothetical protein
MLHYSKKYVFFLLQFLFLSSVAFSQTTDKASDSNQKAQKLFADVAEKFKPMADLSTGDLMIKIGLNFLGAPYVANTLEGNENEKLVVNLSEFDCTTFAENCLALALTMKAADVSFEQFKQELLKIRYRNGELKDYTSRLHYFSDWIYNNEQKHLVKNLSCEMGNFPFNNTVNFMSKHAGEYKMLANNTVLIKKTIAFEKSISSRKSCYIPKSQIAKYQSAIHDGDILGITTNIPGMDMAHVVLAYHQNGQLHILHASSKEHKVVISTQTLQDYLSHRTDATGIMVARPL